MDSYVLMLQTDPDDKDITESALQEIDNGIPLYFIPGINELEDFVAITGMPSVILLNDRGATHNCHAILKQLKNDASYNHIPVVVLGEVSSTAYIRQCYRAGANTFITKPSSVEDTRKKIAAFFDYWFDVAEV